MATSSGLELFTKLNINIEKKNWAVLSTCLNPKFFGYLDSGDVTNFQILATVARVLTDNTLDIPEETQIVLLKCVGNSCFSSYKHKKYEIDHIKSGKYCNELYSLLAYTPRAETLLGQQNLYSFSTHFPYDGVALWSADYIVSFVSHTINQPSQNQVELLRLSIQFLCNLFTFACKSETLPECVMSENLKEAIIELINYEHESVSKVSCIFVHNLLNDVPKKYFTLEEIKHLCVHLLKAFKENVTCAKEAMMLLLNKENTLQDIYENLSMEDKLYILEIIYNDVSLVLYQSQEKNWENTISKNVIELLVKTFCRKSDLILKTIDTYIEGVEPREVIILLNIFAVLTSMDNLKFLEANRSLLINCTYLLKSIHMVGKASENCFTPVQNLKDVAAGARTAMKELCNGGESKSNGHIEEHPAFGFKVNLIRVIGNMSYQNKACQDMLREMDAIPLLLDCCNIDARNPLIIQWTILAIRNLCEGNMDNQEIIRNSSKVGVVDTSILQEMGLTLHENVDGESIGIVPLVREKRN